MKNQNYPIILMYHGITANGASLPENRVTGAELYDVTVESFEEQLQWLFDNGYFVGKSGLDSLSVPDEKKVILTFDDGEMNNCTQALSMLQKFQHTAYFFIIGKNVRKPGYMGWAELRKMHEAGMTIGSHGLTHEILTNLLDTQVEEELLASKRYLERNLNIPIDALSIPRGFCNEKIIKMAREVGYNEIFVSDKPSNIHSPCHGRVAIKGTWALERFARAIEGKMSLSEKIFDTIKKSGKFVLRDTGYNFSRNVILKIFK